MEDDILEETIPWEKALKRHLAQKTTCNIITQFSGRVGKTYISKKLRAYIEGFGNKKAVGFTLDNYDNITDLCNFVNLKSITTWNGGFPPITVKNGRRYKREHAENSLEKVREINLKQFDTPFGFLIDNKDVASSVFDIPCWATMSFHKYVISMDFKTTLKELGIKTNIHIPIINLTKDGKGTNHLNEIREMYGASGYQFFIWKNHFEGEVDDWELGKHLYDSDIVVDIYVEETLV